MQKLVFQCKNYVVLQPQYSRLQDYLAFSFVC